MSVQPVTFLGRAEALLGTRAAASVNQGMLHLTAMRDNAVSGFPLMEAMRDRARVIRLHALANLDRLLSHFADQVIEHGGAVHFAGDAAEANQIVARILEETGSHLVVKSKSMVSEEIDLNRYLEDRGFEVVETDLGEFIVQLAGDTPSHIVAPIIHLDRHDVGALFAKKLGVEETSDPTKLNQVARDHLREIFLRADAGISGVNIAVAESGSVITVTNEGNGRLVTTAPRVHIALLGMERVVSRWEDASVILEVLARSATGQRLSSYTNVVTGPRRQPDEDGPEQLHVVVIDNGRSQILGSDTAEILACIRCGACLNVCPVFRTVGGHAYGSIYSGPVGSIVTPGLLGMEPWWELPYASTLCGACEEVCPIRIQIPSMLLKLRARAAEEGRLPGWLERGMRRYTSIADSSSKWERAKRLVHTLTWPVSRGGWIRRLPGRGRGWTAYRDFPRPARESFSAWWRSNRGA
ncbi:MAG TPA: LutB/LldF family L-lactate oxidation iron-sulfur protein [Acidimicrobiia bacterium]|nr:LutB/LldF family L-lactate oxidation iron-sulfur protein [Acidimicrobiia bacterium]